MSAPAGPGGQALRLDAPTPRQPASRGQRRGALALAWTTIAWNSIEAVVAIASGRAADSIALIGFGLNSIVEVGSAVVVVWQFSGADQEREERALRLISLSFFGFAAYVGGRALWDLTSRTEPSESTVGIALAVASIVVMPLLAAAKRRLGRHMGSRTVVADSSQTLLCSYLSVVLLVGLLANATLGWWWADPLAALVIAGLAVREGRSAWRGDTCCETC
ncbi:MAG: cation transporter [Microthrixaceae bacterium]|nr:cation transporter [Microthrixaceae bacterium]